MAVVLAGLLPLGGARAAVYADAVVEYRAGTGSASGYGNPSAALGEPSRVTPGEDGGPVDPFNPPYLPEQLVSIGTGGLLTVSMSQPIHDLASNPFGVDFIIFGNNGFTIVNGDFTGGGITDGSTFTFDPPGASRVSVSADGLVYYTLEPPPGVAPVVDGLFPTDGSGDFQVPVDPTLTGQDFAESGMAGIRALYRGSGGGTGFDLAWARNADGQPANLSDARFLRVEVLSGKVEVDGLVAVPEPVTGWSLASGALLLGLAQVWKRKSRRLSQPSPKNSPSPHASLLLVLLALGNACSSHATAFKEDFADEPAARGWRVFGQSGLFAWNRESGALEVTWDSSQPNSYYYRLLGNVLSKADDFAIAFDLRLRDIAIGVDPGKPYTFQIAIGLMQLAGATQPSFLRGSGIDPASGPRNLVEFNYFPDSGFGATFAPTVVSINNRIAFSDNHPLELTVGDWFHVVMVYAASNQVLRTTVTRNGAPYGLPPNDALRELSLAGFPDFRVDTLAVASYSDAGQNPPQFAGSVLAHGTVDNLAVDLPTAPVEDLEATGAPGNPRVQFIGKSNWVYVLERSADLETWETVSSPMPGLAGPMVLAENSPSPQTPQFYRVWADKP